MPSTSAGTSPEAQPRLQRLLGVTELDLVGDAVLVTDADGTIIDLNDAFVRQTGYTREEAIGQTPQLLSSGVHGDEVYAELWSTISAGRVWEGELVDRRRDGDLRTYRITITPVHDGHGRITHFVGVQRDIAADVAHHPIGGSVGVAHTDATAACLFADEQVARLLGRRSADLVGDGLLGALRRDDASELRDVVGRAVETGRLHRLELQTEAGGWLGVEAGPLTVGSGATIGARLAFEDVTDRLEARAALARQKAIVASVLDTFDDPIAVIGPDARVLATNAAWRDRQTGGGAQLWPSVDVGDDVLARLRAHAADGRSEAALIAVGLDRVLTGMATRQGAVPGVGIFPLAWDEGGAIVRLGD